MTTPALITRCHGALAALLALPLLATTALANEDLIFQGDASFAGPHGGQTIEVALVNVTSGEVVDTATGTVLPENDPTFSFEFPAVLEEGNSYEVHYWIDSNFGGGSEGSCDEVGVDHQWLVALEGIGNPVTQVVTHDPSAQTAVCDTFE